MLAELFSIPDVRSLDDDNLKSVIEHIREAAAQISSSKSDRARHLSNLSHYLRTRYHRETKLEDLTQALKYSEEAVDLLFTDNSNRAECLDSLSLSLKLKYYREGKLEDLAQAIRYSQEAVNLMSIRDLYRASYSDNLSILFATRYRKEGKLEDLIHAVKYSQDAVHLISADDPYRATYLHNLSINLGTKSEGEDGLETLTLAINYNQEAVELTPTDSPDRANCLCTLSVHLNRRYERGKRLEDLNHAIKYGTCAIKCLSSPPLPRIRACSYTVFFLARLGRWQEARALLDLGVEILPMLISNLSSKLGQEDLMHSVSRLAAIGCVVLLEGSNDGWEAIRLLELSRGTIIRLTTNSRAEISILRRLDSELAEQFEDLRSIINAPNKGSEDLGKSTLSREAAVSNIRDLVAQIRKNEGYEDFPILYGKNKLLEHSSNQVSVILNTTCFRTDALLIHNDGRVQILPLDDSVFQKSRDYYSSIGNRFGYDKHGDRQRSNKDMRLFLIWLWDEVVDPILHAFGFKRSEILSLHEDEIETSCITQYGRTDEPRTLDPERLTASLEFMKRNPKGTSSASSAEPSDARSGSSTKKMIPNLPRIHWIGVGHLGSFPFHAAGYGLQDPSKNAMSCAISSYASTLTARTFAKQKSVILDPSSSTLLLVTMPKTPGGIDLPGVEKEAEVIRKGLDRSVTIKSHESQPVDEILEDLPSCNYVHFACHDNADSKSPIRSGLVLCGNEPEKCSTLAAEIVSSINTDGSVLAFLSACFTAKNASSEITAGGFNVAGAFQLAGYPHVIASLWEADDDISVAIAAKFYQSLFTDNGIIGHDRVAYALHDAVLTVRRRFEERGLDEPLAWATTIHFGP